MSNATMTIIKLPDLIIIIIIIIIKIFESGIENV
jgi:hypothetical protein